MYLKGMKSSASYTRLTCFFIAQASSEANAVGVKTCMVVLLEGHWRAGIGSERSTRPTNSAAPSGSTSSLKS